MEYSETDVFWRDFLVSLATILAILANLKLNSKMWKLGSVLHHILSQYGHISHFLRENSEKFPARKNAFWENSPLK